MSVLALIPARVGSRGIPGKNFRPLAGLSPVQRAINVCEGAGIGDAHVFVSTDAECASPVRAEGAVIGDRELYGGVFLSRPRALAQDDTPMIDVVQHALAAVPGPEDQIILLVQPTQPLRQPKHLQAAIDLLRTSGADSVVSVVELPRTHHPEWQLVIEEGRLERFELYDGYGYACREVWLTPARRQCFTDPTYIRDGTVYAFWRRTVTACGNIYGGDVRPLIIDPEETCALDTPLDWAEAERRLRAGVPAYDHDDAEADG